MKKIILASASPRRKDLLEQIGVSCQVMPSLVEEKITSTRPDVVVQELSHQKCKDVAERVIQMQKEQKTCAQAFQIGTENRQLEEMPNSCIVLGSDTVVAFKEKILGKPGDRKMAEDMLWMLQGNIHQVYTGVTLISCVAGEIRAEETFYEKTDVQVAAMTREEILDYIATGDPMDKAGAYGIQGVFAKHVEQIHGDYNNVVGLPTAAVYRHLKVLEDKS